MKPVSDPQLIRVGRLLWEAEEAQRAYYRVVRGHLDQAARRRPSDAILRRMGLDELRRKKFGAGYSVAVARANAKARQLVGHLLETRRIP